MRLLSMLIVIITGFFIIGSPMIAIAQTPFVVVEEQTKQYSLGKHLDILEDSTGNLTITDISSAPYTSQFNPSQTDVPNLGLTTSAYWVRFQLQNNTVQPQTWLLELNFANNLQYIDFYHPLPNQTDFEQHLNGTARPFFQQEISYQNSAFKINLPPHTNQTFYLRVQSNSPISLPITLWSVEGFLEHIYYQQWYSGIFYGMLLIMAIYNLFIYISLQDKAYLYYTLFLVTFAICQSIFDDIILLYTPDNWVWLISYILPLIIIVLMIFLILFTTQFLGLKRRFYKYHQIAKSFIGVWVGGYLVFLSLGFNLFSQIFIGWAILTFGFILYCSWSVWWQGYRPARYYLLGWGLFFVTLVVYFVVLFGKLSNTIFVYGYYISVTLLILSFALALTDRINLLQTDLQDAHAHMQKNESRLTQFLEAMPIGVYVINRQGQITYINKLALQILGIDAPTSISSITNILRTVKSYVTKTDQPYPVEALPVMQALQGKVVSVDDIDILPASASDRITLEVFANPIYDEHGEIQYSITAFRDINRRKQIEAELMSYRTELEKRVADQIATIQTREQHTTALLNAIPDLMFHLSYDGRYLDLHSPNYDLFPTDPNNFLGHTIQERLLTPVANLILDKITQTLTKQTMQTFDFQLNIPEKSIEFEARMVPADEETVIVILRDITAQKQALQALADSEERWLLALEGTNAGIFDWYIPDDIAYFAPRWKEIIGYTDHEFPNKSEAWREQIHPHDLPWVELELTQYLTDKIPFYQTEYRMRHKDGSYRWILAHAKALWDENDEPIRVVGSHIDITSRKQMENDLRFSEELFRTMLEAAPEGVIVVNSQGEIILVNQLAETMFGYSKTELLGQTIECLIPTPQREQHIQNRATYLLKPELRLMSTQRHILGLKKDGTTFPVEVRLNTINMADDILTTSIISDITERVQAEEEITKANDRISRLLLEEQYQRRLAESLHELGMVLNRTLDLNTVLSQILQQLGQVVPRKGATISLHENEKLRIVAAIGISETYMGYTFMIEDNEPTGRTFTTQQPLVIADICHNSEWQTLLQAEDIRSWVSAPLLLDNKTIGVLAVVDTRISTYTADDAVVLQSFANQAATAIHNARLFKAAQEAKESAEQANRVKSTFLANMSHELRTPLNGVLGYAQILMADTTLSQSQKAGLEVITRSGNHLLNLINDVLDISKIEAQKMELDKVNFIVGQFLYEIIEMVEVWAQKKGLNLDIDLDPTLPVVVYSDKKRLGQVLLNLLSNAIKFTEIGQIVLRVCNSPLPDNHPKEANLRYILFEVIDTGIGIPKRLLDDIFSPFQQVKHTNMQAEGTGLGLSISQKIVELLGGNLSVKSTVGQGSHFWFEIPLLEVTDSVPDDNLIDTRYIIGIEGEKRKLLVVDDNNDNRTMVVNLLLPLGFEVIQATDGLDCLVKTDTFQPDLVIMDVIMPNLDGFETAKKLRQTYPEIKIILISASASIAKTEMQAYQNWDDYLTQPLKFEELFAKLKQYLNISWVYDTSLEIEMMHLSDETIIPPSASDIEQLLFALSIGDFTQIFDLLTELSDRDAQYKPFVKQAWQWADMFDVENLQQFFYQYKKSEAQIS